MNYEQKFIEIPFGANDSELKSWEYTIPDGMEAIVKDGKVIIKEKESEDERIRKSIILLLQRGGYMSPEDKDKAYAWLEKQKEASKAIEAVEKIDKYIDEHLANAHDMKDSNPDKKYYRGWDDALGKMSVILQDVYSEEKQKEQKPISFNIPYNPDDYEVIMEGDATSVKLKEQKPIGDKVFEEWIDGWYNEYHRNGYITMDKREFKNFCRGIRNMYQQKPAEWSEEDEKMNKEIRLYLKQDRTDFPGRAERINKMIEWLINICPNSQWKPSEEQMEALEETINQDCVVCNGDRKWIKPNLESLYEQLKKMKAPKGVPPIESIQK